MTQTATQERPFLDMADMIRILGLSRNTILSLMHAGDIVGSQPGGRIYKFHPDEPQRFLERTQVQAVKAAS